MAKVDIHLMRWHEDREVDIDDEFFVLAAGDAIIDGERVRDGQFRLEMDGFVTIWIPNPSPALWDAHSDPDVHLEGSSSEILGLPVTDLRLVLKPY